jgi:hypothetical protein
LEEDYVLDDSVCRARRVTALRGYIKQQGGEVGLVDLHLHDLATQEDRCGTSVTGENVERGK